MPAQGLPEVVASLEDLDPRVQQFYDRNDDGSYSLTDISGLKNAKNREKEDRKRAQDELNRLKSKYNGLENEELEQLIKAKQEKEENERKMLEERGQFGVLKQQLMESAKKIEKQLTQERDKYKNLLEDYVATDHLTRALIEHGASDFGKKILPDLVKKRMKVEINEEERPVIKFFDQSGRELQVNERQEPFALNDFVESLQSEYQEAFLHPGKSGAGSAVVASHLKRTGTKISQMSDDQKTKFIEEFGEQAYLNQYRAELQAKRSA